MEPREAAAVLAKAAAYDHRRVDEADVLAWSEALSEAEVSLADAVRAVTLHYTRSRDWLMPFDVIGLALGMRRERQARGGLVDLPPGLDQATEREYRRRYWALLAGDGSVDREQAHLVVDRSFGIVRAPVAVPMPAELRAAVESAFSMPVDG